MQQESRKSALLAVVVPDGLKADFSTHLEKAKAEYALLRDRQDGKPAKQ